MHSPSNELLNKFRSQVHRNLTAEQLTKAAVARGEGRIVNDGSLAVTTGKHTGRSAGDKYVVREPSTQDFIWWGKVNQPYDPARFNELRDRMVSFLSDKEVYIQDVYACADSKHRLGVRFITERETPAEPLNYLLRTAGATEATLHTRFPDPTPQLRKITKQLVTYKRADGVPLSFTLYLPPDYQPGQRLPTLVWAYPLEFNDADTAGQVSGSTNRFTAFGGSSHLFFLLQGCAVLDGATMPIVGTPETMNDTFIKQIVDSAKAAIDKAVELGVTDPSRVGVGGHSYGAFMTANLLAHSELFRAGIARSGAYNRTLTPFGFQGERRTFWEAPDIYTRLSPFMHADKIKEPILLIHGERDDNSGTFPVQSERLYQAIKGNGGNVRYVTLPFEAHGYAARESIEHTLHEMLSWFDQHVKNAPSKPAELPRSIGN